jgi:hypothetical protein
MLLHLFEPSAGDVNGDGLDDLIVGAWGVTLNDKIDIGKSYVIFGKTNSSAINLSKHPQSNHPNHRR